MGVGNSVNNPIYSDSNNISEEIGQISVEHTIREHDTDSSLDETLDESFQGKHSLKFHQVCGSNIQFSKRSRVAERKERTFCDAIVFSHRPVALLERVTLKIKKQSTNWNGVIKFGFTSLDPAQFEDVNNNNKQSLPKYVYPDMTNQRGCWAGSLSENLIKENDLVYFYVTPNGEIHFGINEKYMGLFLDGVEVASPNGNVHSLWAIFDIYGNTTAVELIKTTPLESTNNESLSLSSTSTLSAGSNNHSLNATLQSTSSYTSTSISNSSTSIGSSSVITVIPNRNFSRQAAPAQPVNNDAKLEELLVTFRRLCVDNHLNETLHNSILESGLESHLASSLTSRQSSLKMRNFYSTVPILFHESDSCALPSFRFITKCHGKTVKISQPDGLLAYRDENIINRTQLPTRNAYVFLDKPLDVNQTLCVQVVGVDQKLNELKMSLGIGCTTCQPETLNAVYDLPDDADDLLERPEYWIVYKNIFNNVKQASLADELCFKLDKLTGDLDFYINASLVKKCLFNVDTTQKLWFFFDLCGRTNAIRLIPSCHRLTNQRTTSTSSARPNSALIELYKSQLMTDGQSDPTSEMTSRRKASNSSNKDECRICWEAPIECVFNTCGHMCVCYKCAMDLKNQSVTNYTAREELNRSATLVNEPSNGSQPSKNPLCPICRKEITDIIRFFKA